MSPKRLITIPLAAFLVLFVTAQSSAVDKYGHVTPLKWPEVDETILSGPHSFQVVSRSNGYVENRMGRFKQDTATKILKLFIVGDHIMYGDSSYHILYHEQVARSVVRVVTIKDKGKSAMDTAAIAPFYTDSVARWEIDIHSGFARDSTIQYEISFMGKRWKEYPANLSGKAYNGFGIYRLICRQIN